MSSPLPPGPRMPPVAQIAAWVKRPGPFMRRAQQRYGDVFTVRLMGRETLVLLADPDHVREVFTGPSEVLRAGEANEILLPILGPRSVLLLDGPEHLRQRRLLLPPFHGRRMQGYHDAMVEATEREVATWRLGDPIALAPRMQRITLEVIMRTVFGIDDAEQLARLRAVLLEMLEWTVQPWKLMLFAALGPQRMSALGALRRVLEPVARELGAEIARRRGDPALAERDDVLSLLLQARDEDGEGLTDAELRDELVTLLVAGHETTATGLGWALERLLRHPDALARATADARGGGDGGEYVAAVVTETLRLRPVIPVVARRLAEPMTLAGHDLPAGVAAAPCIYLVHRRPDVYPEPDRFRPERFLEVKPGTYTWLPFGGGVRRCLGASFALFEMETVLRTILERVTLRAVGDAAEPTARRAVTLAPARGAMAARAA